MTNTIYSVEFEQFYKIMGFEAYPFRNRTAEKEDVSKLFIKPLDYSRLEDDLKSRSSTIICGNRGSGKTMTIMDLKNTLENHRPYCFIDNFEDVGLEDNQLDFYSVILKHLTQTILLWLDSHKKFLKRADPKDKLLLSFLIEKYKDSFTDAQLYSELEKIQLSGLRRFINKISVPLTSLLNYGSTAVTNFGNEVLTKHFGPYLPEASEGTIKKIFPDIHFPVEKQFNSVEISYELLDRALQMFKRVTQNTPVVFIDKLDEDRRLDNDAELVSAFIKELICDSKLLLNSNLQLIISVWEIPFHFLNSVFRQSKITVYDMKWNTSKLETALNHRLSVYSNEKITEYHQLIDPNTSQSDIDDIYLLANSNPRDLWTIYDSIFNAQYSINCESKILCQEAVQVGLKNFVQNFHFYEYYPRKKAARRNTNDVYSYINYLLKLRNTNEFTHDELRDQASTGGSTTNYITGMMNIGLVKKTGRKRPGGSVIYQISDPKVTYAIMHDIEISDN